MVDQLDRNRLHQPLEPALGDKALGEVAGQQDQQQKQGDEQQQSDSSSNSDNNSDSESNAENASEQEGQQQQQTEAEQTPEPEPAAQENQPEPATETDDDTQEHTQAIREAWPNATDEEQQQLDNLLRKVQDDPALLLRNKMYLEYLKRQQQRLPTGVDQQW